MRTSDPKLAIIKNHPERVVFFYLIPMGYRVLIGLLFMAVTCSLQGQVMEKYLWKNRLLVIRHQNEAAAREVVDRFKEFPSELEDRDLLLFLCHSGGCTDEAGADMDFAPHQFKEGVTLIGKDGGVKFEGGLSTPVSHILDLIDSMPMRKAEMRRKGSY